MTHFALICPPLHSHVRALEALGETLIARGHRATFVLNAGGGTLLRPRGKIDLRETREDRPPATAGRAMPDPNGLLGILRTVKDGADRTQALCAQAPGLLRSLGVDAVLGDQMEPASGLVAEHLRLPFVSISSALPIDPDPAIPAPFLGWPYDPSKEGLRRNRGGERVARLLLHRHREVIRAAASQFGLAPRQRMEDCLSPLATLSQIVPAFDFPRSTDAGHFAVGPLRDETFDEADLPLDRDPLRPLVFASLGTLQGHRITIFRAIARACRALGVQLVVAHCGRLSPAQAATIDADLVTDFVPQRTIMRRVDACITHAGLNTVLDAMEFGVPVLAIPIAYDQPGVAARVVHHGVGLRLSRRRLTAGDIKGSLARLLCDETFRANASRIGAEIRLAGGRGRAADLVERLVCGAGATTGGDRGMSGDHDLILAGGGLANGLIAFRLKERRPDLRILVVEGGDRIGGNHTWSFHEGDLSPVEHQWMDPFVVHRWPGYDVRFPKRQRPVTTGYASVASDRFARVLTEQLGEGLMTGAPIAALTPTAVTLKDGRTFTAKAVIDGRGYHKSAHLRLGFQKFLGQEWELEQPHGLTQPIIMDATVPQSDGYRFVYVLPFSPTRLLIEDTYYADGAALNVETLRGSIASYAAGHGWALATLVREEHGILPIALGGDMNGLISEAAGVPTVGLARALFHPTTGYSLADAVHVADLVAIAPDLSADGLSRLLAAHARNLWEDRSYFRMLNRLLFLGGEPSTRYRILEHFHRLPDPLLSRFYAARLAKRDKIRILVGKPPISVRRALRVLADPSYQKDHE